MGSEKRTGAEELRHRDWSKIGREFEVYEKKFERKIKKNFEVEKLIKLPLQRVLYTHTRIRTCTFTT